MSGVEREDQKEQVDKLFHRLVETYIRGFWKSYVSLVACLSRANMAVLLSSVHQPLPKMLDFDVVVENLRARGEDPWEWCFLVILKENPPRVPVDKALPPHIISGDGKIKVPIYVEVVVGLETL